MTTAIDMATKKINELYTLNRKEKTKKKNLLGMDVISRHGCHCRY